MFGMNMTNISSGEVKSLYFMSGAKSLMKLGISLDRFDE